MKFSRRLSDIPDGLMQSRGGSRCPDIWETDEGDIIVIGDDVTDAAREVLPDDADISGPERAVRIPVSVLRAALKRL